MQEIKSESAVPGPLRSPGEVAEVLGVSPSGLRRLASIYARERGELPRDPRTRTRLWPQRAVDELATARKLVLDGRVPSIREALNSIECGGMELERGEATARPSSADVLRALIEEVGSLRREVDELRREMVRMSRASARVQASGPGELQELRRRLRYLQNELELREL